jgi:hypothetical protein
MRTGPFLFLLVPRSEATKKWGENDHAMLLPSSTAQLIVKKPGRRPPRLSLDSPQKLDEEATLALVLTTIAELGVDDPKQTGRVMGTIMKDHGKDVDGGLVSKLVAQQLKKPD